MTRRHARATALAATLAALLASCGGGSGGSGGAGGSTGTSSDTPSSSTTTTTTTNTSTDASTSGGDPGAGPTPPAQGANVPRFAYVANSGDDTLSIYIVDPASGRLRHNGYVQTQASPHGVAVHPSGRFVYVANWGANSVSAYAVQSGTGGLVPVGVVAAGTWPFAVTVDPSGRFAYVANEASFGISAYRIDAATGALSEIDQNGAAAGTVAPTLRDPRAITVDPSGRFAYVANAASNGITAYAIDPDTGALAEIDQNGAAAGTAASDGGLEPQSLVVHPSGRYVLVANRSSNTVSAYAIDATTGALSSVGTLPAGMAPTSIAVDPSGRFAYVANAASHNVSTYAFDPATGTLQAGAVVPAISPPTHVSVDPSGRFAYVASAGANANTVQAFTIDAATGALAPAGTVSTREGPLSLAMSQGAAAVQATPRFAYAASYGPSMQSNPAAYRIDPATGGLARVPSAGTGGLLTAVATDPSGRFAYTAREILIESPDQVSLQSWRIDAGTGALAQPANPAVMGSNPRSVATDPSGRFVYVAYEASAAVGAYALDPATGALTSAGLVNTGVDPSSVAVDPSGRFAYVVNKGSGSVAAYRIHPGTGALTEIDQNGAAAGSALAVGTAPRSIALEPTGRFAYLTMTDDARLAVFRIDASTGALAAVDTRAVGASTPTSLAFSPDGRFGYATHAGSNDVTALAIDAGTGLPGVLGTAATGADPSAITVDASGRFAYVANGAAGTVSFFRLDATSGMPTATGPAVAAEAGPSAIATTATID